MSREVLPGGGGGTGGCLLCGGPVVRHFRLGGELTQKAVGDPVYRITHSERSLCPALQRCTRCGLVMLPPELRNCGTYDQGADPQYVEHARERVLNAHRILALLPHGGRLLDVGCACGFLLVAARERGFAGEGVEPSVWASEFARREYGLQVVTGRVETADLPPETYDAVVLADVIEHMDDPRRTLRAVRRVLKQGGRVLILTPDIGSLVARVAGVRWWGLLDDHYVYFSRQTLPRLLGEEGFVVERCQTFGRCFAVEHWVYKLSQYSRTMYRVADRLCRAVRIHRLNVSINLGDQMVCMARKI